jgi:formyltetrahydrofolate deformylase
MRNTATILIHCPDRPGIIAAVTDFLYENNGNIIDLDQHVDREQNLFFMRIEWELDAFSIPVEKIDDYFGTLIGHKFGMQWKLHFTRHTPKMGIFVSKMSHCLHDILQRYDAGEWAVEIPFIISNHPDLAPLAAKFNIPYHVFPINEGNKSAQEQAELALIREYKVDFIVLARYMQVLSNEMVSALPYQIINIHHSFLPAFIGAKPYHAAYKRGVKIIGATSHYVTEDLDEGPIIAQDVCGVSHNDSVEDMIRKGRDLEKMVLSQAIWLQLQNKILPYQNKTIVF